MVTSSNEHGYRVSRSNDGNHYIYIWDKKGSAAFYLTAQTARQLIKDIQEVVLNDTRN